MRKLILPSILMVVVSFTASFKMHRTAETMLIPYSGAIAVNMCTGETVTFSGSMLIVSVNTSNQNKFGTKTLAKPQDLSFVSNGETFRALGMTMLSANSIQNSQNIQVAGVNNMLFIGETSGTKYLLNESGRYELAPDGSISSFIYNRQLRCP